jgi:hypothetical protein
MDWRCGSTVERSPEFKLQCHQKKKRTLNILASLRGSQSSRKHKIKNDNGGYPVDSLLRWFILYLLLARLWYPMLKHL